MTVIENILKDKMILVCYDFLATSEGNRDRAIFRDQLTGKPFHAVQMTASVYYLPESVASISEVRRWAKNTNADIRVFGNIEANLADKRKLAKGYYHHLLDIVKEVNEIAKRCRKELMEFEENIEDPDATLRGWATKISGVTNRFEEIRKLINRVGDSDDEFHLDMLATFVKALNERYERVKKMKADLKKK